MVDYNQKEWELRFTMKMEFINLEKHNHCQWPSLEMELLLKDLSFSHTKVKKVFKS